MNIETNESVVFFLSDIREIFNVSKTTAMNIAKELCENNLAKKTKNGKGFILLVKGDLTFLLDSN